MIDGRGKFLIDSNSLITPYKLYYPFDFARNFWDQLLATIENQNVIMLDLVKQELLKGNDALSEWVDSINHKLILNRRDTEIISSYSEVLNYLQTSGSYKETALATWSQAHVADPWLIAAARVYGFTVITLEKSNGGLKGSTKMGNAKIPDICNVFDVKCEDLFYMIRELSFFL